MSITERDKNAECTDFSAQRAFNRVTKADITDICTEVNAKEPAISIGTTSQYWRGDKSWQTITTLGTITTGTWNGTAIADSYISSASTWNAKLSATLTDSYIFVGNGSNVAVGVAVSGDVTISNAGVVTIANSAITYGKIQNVSATNKLLGRYSSGSGIIEEISLGSGFSLISGVFTFSNPGLAHGRLTFTSGSPVMTSTVSSAGTIYYTPYNGNLISLYNGTSWKTMSFSEISLSLTLTSDKNYDVFAYDNSGTVTLELSAAWTNDTTRADTLTLQDGVYVKSGATTRKYLGTLRASGTNVSCFIYGGIATGGTEAKLYLYNQYNQLPFAGYSGDNTDTWTYSTLTWRSSNNSTTMRTSFVLGQSQQINASFIELIKSSTTSASAGIGIGLDSTSAMASQSVSGYTVSTSIVVQNAYYTNQVALGYHYIQALERGAGAGTQTFYGDTNLSTYYTNGLFVEVWL